MGILLVRSSNNVVVFDNEAAKSSFSVNNNETSKGVVPKREVSVVEVREKAEV
jgi:hypothetical protein